MADFYENNIYFFFILVVIWDPVILSNKVD